MPGTLNLGPVSTALARLADDADALGHLIPRDRRRCAARITADRDRIVQAHGFTSWAEYRQVLEARTSARWVWTAGWPDLLDEIGDPAWL